MTPDLHLIESVQDHLPQLPDAERYTVIQAIEIYEGFCALADHDYESGEFARVVAAYLHRISRIPLAITSECDCPWP